MPTYQYECEKCNFTFDIKQLFEEKSLLICPLCKEKALYRVINPVQFFVRGEPTTVQQLADKNTRNMGTYEYQDRVHTESAGRKDFAKFASGDKSPVPGMSPEKYGKLVNATPEQTRKYIDTGEL